MEFSCCFFWKSISAVGTTMVKVVGVNEFLLFRDLNRISQLWTWLRYIVTVVMFNCKIVNYGTKFIFLVRKIKILAMILSCSKPKGFTLLGNLYLLYKFTVFKKNYGTKIIFMRHRYPQILPDCFSERFYSC